MSSAILYLAIVAIWACVLIPRWLRRDSARGASAPVAAHSVVLVAECAVDSDVVVSQRGRCSQGCCVTTPAVVVSRRIQ